MNNVNHYYKKAKVFCNFLEGNRKFELANSQNFILNLLDIYSAALDLPDMKPNTGLVNGIYAANLSISFGEFDIYWEVHNPKECDEPVCGSLYDDFTTIYKELKIGISLFEQNEINNAVWHWKWSFENHWSYHAVDALRALNCLLLS